MTPREQPLTRDEILAAALVIVDEGGPDALSMRKLASALGVEAMTLYHHFTNK
ncbi:MAG TPA: helix-turn-helix domain-containing protein, partial [Coriobacteriia bacterium]|nr:helix-turn-helix domain-containing protein [Coriobacteriia bacterium]